MAKPQLEWFRVDEIEWRPVPGAVPGCYEKILAVDEAKGVVTRLSRMEPGTDTSSLGVTSHTFWEEQYILEGSFRDLSLGRTFSRGSYACRPPGMPHGPWQTDEGSVTLEVRYHGDSPSDDR